LNSYTGGAVHALGAKSDMMQFDLQSTMLVERSSCPIACYRMLA